MHKNDTPLFLMMQDSFSGSIVEGVKILLENKHLYQSHVVTFPAFETVLNTMMPELSPITDPKMGGEVKKIYDQCFGLQWRPIHPHGRQGGFLYYTDSDQYDASIDFASPTIKVFCTQCDNTEPFNFETGGDALVGLIDEHTHQVFILVYRCQACKGIPEVFLVRRVDMKLTLCGRSPIEKVSVSTYIPKRQRKYLRDAIVAYNSGQVLGGIFLLRTFLEQYVRSVSKESGDSDIEKLFTEYGESLPDDFRDRFPSLYSVYGVLSDAIHRADEDEEIFTNAKGDIEQHFDAKRIFKIS